MYCRVRVGRTLEYVLPGSGVGYSIVRPTRVWRTLEYVTTKKYCTLESKSCLESVADPTPTAPTNFSAFSEKRGKSQIGEEMHRCFLGMDAPALKA